MSFLSQISWMPLLALDAVLLAFVLIHILDSRINWTLVILIALALGVGIGIAFRSEGNAWLVWVDLLGAVYIKLLKLLVAPVILVSIVSGFISLQGRANAKRVGLRSVLWLMAQAALAIALSIAVAELLHIGDSAGNLFDGLDELSSDTVSAYAGLTQPFDQVISNLLPVNIVTDFAENNVTAIIITGVAIAAAYLAVAKREGEEKVKPLYSFVEAARLVVFRILEVVIDLTPYAVLCLIAGSASRLVENSQAVMQLLLLAAVVYGTCLAHTYLLGGAIIKLRAKLNPVRFFRRIFPAQITAFTTQSSVGTLPVTVRCLKEEVGVSGEIADFTASLGTTIGMPGCTSIWPVLLVLFYAHAMGLGWGFGEYAALAVTTFFLSVGSAGVPGIGIVSAVALFSAIGLPVGAVIIMIPINTISDMVRTMNNVSAAAIASAAVARENGLLDDAIFNRERSTAAIAQTEGGKAK